MSTIDLKTTITGLQQAQAANVRLIGELKPAGAFGRAIQYATAEAHREAVSRTHVDTGALRGSHRMQVSGLHGEIYLDPGARSPKTGELVEAYGATEHARGGAHAFYRRTVDEAGLRIGRAAASRLTGQLP